MPETRFAIVVACNDEAVLNRNLCQSSFLKSDDVEVLFLWGAQSASRAYNEGLRKTSAPFVVFVHQDVYFPSAFRCNLETVLGVLDNFDPDWAVFSPFGVSVDGDHKGRVWSSSLGRVIGDPVLSPIKAQSFDELAFIMKRSSSVTFDDTMPGFHLYGTDVVQQAVSEGHSAYVVDLPVVHNDAFKSFLKLDFLSSMLWLSRKWGRVLPLTTPCVSIDKLGVGFLIENIRLGLHRSGRKRRAIRETTDPRAISFNLGWESEPTALTLYS